MGKRLLVTEGLEPDSLPFIIAWSFERIDRERHPVARLWNTCEAAELLVRFAFAIGAMSLSERNPEALGMRIGAELGRPTLGRWLELLRRVAAEAPRPALVPELPEFIRQLRDLMGEGRDYRSGLLALRNLVAHGIGMSETLAEDLLHAHLVRLRALVRRARWLREVELLGHAGAGKLVGLRGTRLDQPSPRGSAPEAARDPLSDGAVFLRRGARSLRLWPLLVYDYAQVSRLGEGAPQRDPHRSLAIFSRCEREALYFSPLGANLPVTEVRGPALDAWQRLFSVNAALETGQEAELLAESEHVFGRTLPIQTVEAALASPARPVLWIHGAPGIGKSALMARIATRLKSSAGARQLAIPYVFKTGDPQCTQDAFLKRVIQALQSWRPLAVASKQATGTLAQLRMRLEALLARIPPDARVVLVLDGLDEIARVDPTFIELPFTQASERVVWLCAGRATSETRLMAEKAHPVFGALGLEPLSPAEIAEWLKVEAPPEQRNQIVQAEREGEIAPWVVEVHQRSAGVPLFVRYLLEDLCTGAKQVGSPLPSGMIDYFLTLARRTQVDDPAAVLPVLIAAIAWATAAPDAPTLEEVLRRAGVLREETRDRHQSIVAQALDRARVMLRVVRRNGREHPFHEESAYLPFHDELGAFFRGQLGERDLLSNAAALARMGWKALATNPAAGDAWSPSTYHGDRFGIAQLVHQGEERTAIRCLTSFEYLFKRAPFMSAHVISDYGLISRRRKARNLAAWQSFVTARGHLLQAGGQMALLQQALWEPSDTVIHQSAARLLRKKPPKRFWLRRFGVRQADPCQLVIPHHPGAISALAADFEHLRIAVGYHTGDLCIFDLRNGGRLRMFRTHHNARVSALAFLDDSVISGDDKGHLKIAELTGHREHTCAQFGARVASISVGQSLTWLAVEGFQRKLAVLSNSDHSLQNVPIQTDAPVTQVIALDGQSALAITHGGDVLQVSADDGSTRLVNSTTPRGGFQHDFSAWGAKARDVPRLLVFRPFTTLSLIDLESGAEMSLLDAPVPRGGALSPDGTCALVPTGYTLHLRRTDSGQVVGRLDGHQTAPKFVEVDPHFKLAVSASLRNVRLWNLTLIDSVQTPGSQGSASSMPALFDQASSQIDFVHGGELPLSASAHVLKCWDATTGTCFRTFEKDYGIVGSASTRELLLLDGYSHFVRINLETGEESVRVPTEPSSTPGQGFAVTSGWDRALVSQDGAFLLGRKDAFSIWDYDLQSGKRVRALHGHRAEVSALAISYGDRWVLSGSTDGMVRLWSGRTGKTLKVLKDLRGHGRIHAVTFIDSFLSRLEMARPCALVAGEDETLWWEIDSGRTHRLEVGGALCLSADGDRELALLGHASGHIALWNLPPPILRGAHRKRRQVPTLLALWWHDAAITACAFLGADRIIAGDSRGETLFLQLVPPADFPEFL